MRHRSAFIAALVFAAACGRATAQGTAADDAYEVAQRAFDAELAACFGAAESQEDRRACVGVVFESCEGGGAKGLYNNTYASCFLAEAQAWEVQMGAVYAELMDRSRMSDAHYAEKAPDWVGAADALEEAQEAWEAYRIAECGFAYAQWGSGSMRLIDGAMCQRDIFAARTLALAARLGNTQEAK